MMSNRTPLLLFAVLVACHNRADGHVGVDSGLGAVDAGGRVGAHALTFYRDSENNKTSLTTPTLAVQATGSTIVVGVAHGEIKAFATPTGKPSAGSFVQLGGLHAYTRWPESGTGAYALTSATLGKDFTVSTKTAAWDETTMAVVEIRDSSRIQAFEWNEVLDGPLTSRSVTTTGPATLVAFWWGDGNVKTPHTATPNNGFVLIDALLAPGALVQCAVAVKTVATAGTYDVTWTSQEGAQLWLIAVE